MIDLSRRRFLFGLAAVPLVVPAVKHFVLPKFELLDWDAIVRARSLAISKQIHPTEFGHLSEARKRFWLVAVAREARADSLFGDAV